MDDTVFVGDIHAGIAMQRGAANFGLGYMRREYSTDDLSHSEDYAGFTLHIKR